jgi:AcrR family transcriptional regulator
MERPAPRQRTKHQVRTEETQAKILDAAEGIFSEQGFEKTQLEEVAARAGFTRGAIYAHYASKEDLFLSLVEQRVLAKFGMIRKAVESEPEMAKRPAELRQWIAKLAGNHAWGTLMLEYKLYALRRPEAKEKLLHLNELVTRSSGSDFIELLFGSGLDKAARAGVERRMAILGPIMSAVTLESHFRPKLLPERQLRAVLDDLFEALIRI